MSELKIRAVTLDLWLTLIWDTRELADYWKLRRLINFHRFLRTRAGLASSLHEGVSFNDVRLAMEELNGRIEEAYKNNLELSLEERGGMLFDTLGIRFGKAEEQAMRERAGRILSDSGASSRLPHLNPEAKPVLRQLKNEFEGIKIGLISNAGRSTKAYERMLKTMGIMKYFDSLTISCDVGFVKPRREIFEHAVRALSVEPAEVLHVGDSFRADVAGAASFGMNAALYTGLWHRYDNRYGAILEHIPRGFKPRRGLFVKRISSLHEIPKLIEAGTA